MQSARPSNKDIIGSMTLVRDIVDFALSAYKTEEFHEKMDDFIECFKLEPSNDTFSADIIAMSYDVRVSFDTLWVCSEPSLYMKDDKLMAVSSWFSKLPQFLSGTSGIKLAEAISVLENKKPILEDAKKFINILNGACGPFILVFGIIRCSTMKLFIEKAVENLTNVFLNPEPIGDEPFTETIGLIIKAKQDMTRLINTIGTSNHPTMGPLFNKSHDIMTWAHSSLAFLNTNIQK